MRIKLIQNNQTLISSADILCHLDKSADIYVFPEMSTSSYIDDNLYKYAISQDSLKMKEIIASTKDDGAIVLGFLEKEGDKLYSSVLLAENGRKVGVYRKKHLSNYEKNFLTRGESEDVFELAGIKVGIQVCFDLWFPNLSRSQLKKGADILICPCCFGGEQTLILSQARAIENLIPLVLCNRGGEEKMKNMEAFYRGQSRIFNADGTILTSCEDNQYRCVLGEIVPGAKQGNVICSDFSSERKQDI